MDYTYKNSVVVGLAETPAAWKVSGAEKAVDQAVYLHYCTDTVTILLADTMAKTSCTEWSSHQYSRTECKKISLANLKKNEFMKLDFSWEGTDMEKR
jgi:hypothetical protein